MPCILSQSTIAQVKRDLSGKQPTERCEGIGSDDAIGHEPVLPLEILYGCLCFGAEDSIRSNVKPFLHPNNVLTFGPKPEHTESAGINRAGESWAMNRVALMLVIAPLRSPLWNERR